MDALGHYLRIHLTGSAGGIELFSRGEAMPDSTARETVLGIRDELVQEREQLLAMASRVGASPAPLAAVAAKVGERIGRLKPNGDLLHRTPLTDVVDLETMLVAVAGKIAGWQSLIAVADKHDGLRLDELTALLEQARRQHEQLAGLHAAAAARALTR
jgi:hypothetical protein